MKFIFKVLYRIILELLESKQIQKIIRNIYKHFKSMEHSIKSPLEKGIAFSVSNNIIGDYFEFGNYQGKSFIGAYHTFNKYFSSYKSRFPDIINNPYLNQKMRFFAFDSFQGFIEIKEEPVPLHWQLEHKFAATKKEFLNNLVKAKVNLKDIHIIEGFYEDSLKPELREKYQLTKAAVVHIDCDLYSSTKYALKFITPILVDGSIIVFDDFFYFKGHPDRGERKAFYEWLEKNPEIIATELNRDLFTICFIINFR